MTENLIHTMNQTDSLKFFNRGTHVDSWMFMSSPIPVLSILCFYLYFTLNLGPTLMKNRPPFNIQKFLFGYNLYQICFNAWLCSVPIRLGVVNQLFSQSCHKALTNDIIYANGLYHGSWWYFASKVVDLLDTVFFVLRKKQEQVTFLHVYHHTVTCLFSWGYLKYFPGEQGLVIGFLNSLVHVFMYTYYLIAGMGPKYTRYLWWKKYLTWMQLVQFFLMLTYLLSLIIRNCELSKTLTFFFTINVLVFLYLFLRFYKKTYTKKTI